MKQWRGISGERVSSTVRVGSQLSWVSVQQGTGTGFWVAVKGRLIFALGFHQQGSYATDTDINTDHNFSKTMDPDMALGNSSGLDYTMAPGCSTDHSGQLVYVWVMALSKYGLFICWFKMTLRFTKRHSNSEWKVKYYLDCSWE